jgi:CheY-like chemotaxis protein
MLAEQKSAAAFHDNFFAVSGSCASPPRQTKPVVEPSNPPDVTQAGVELVRELQRLLAEVNLAADERRQRLALRNLGGTLDQLNAPAEDPELRPVRQIASAMQILTESMIEKAGSINSSLLRTLEQAVVVLAELGRPGLNPNLLVEPPLRVLVVDDDAFSRFALCQSLERTLNKPEVADGPAKAMALAEENAYDLIFLDVLMPDTDGFQLCEKIHETAKNSSTPVVFVTSLSDAKARAQSVLSGGRDFLTKPFLTFEVTVKALTLASRERMRGRRVGRVSAVPPALEPAA